jgi:L-threonylcarbamoyladenylate synthase
VEASPETSIEEAVAHLARGALVAFPTETVYGLGADARQPLAVRRIFAAKERPLGHPLIAHLPDRSWIERWARPTAGAQELAEAFWPGPLTLILPRSEQVPDEVTGGLSTVGLRIPSHPVASALLQAHGAPIAAPSANRFGRISPTQADHVRAEFGERIGQSILLLDGGRCPVGVESTIVDLSGEQPALLRPGAISPDEIQAITGPLGVSQTPAPGTLASHYSPHTALRLSRHPEKEAERIRSSGRSVATLLATDSTEAYAQRLYAELRRLDALGVDLLIAQLVEDQGLGLAINDRLRRASCLDSSSDH